MSRLQPGLIVLDKGLDLNSAKIAAPEGTLLDSLNYEQVDFMGQKRIDGYVRYDGSLGSYQDELYVLDLDGSTIDGGTVIYVNEKIAGISIGTFNSSTVLALIDKNLKPVVGGTVSDGDTTYTVEGISKLEEITTPEEQYEETLEANQVLRNRATTLPGPVAGLHWFNDRLYAVASVAKRDIGTGYMPNDTWNGYPVLKVEGNLAYIGGASVTGDEIYSEMASLFQSRTEKQAEEELGDANQYGWEFIHQGWVVPYEAGTSLYGGLTALNLNRTGVGVEGPTSIDGSNGKPLILTQNRRILGLPTQVNGWKDSNTPNSYTLDPESVAEEDGHYVYADAYVQWNQDGDITVNPTPMRSRPANHTVEVELFEEEP